MLHFFYLHRFRKQPFFYVSSFSFLEKWNTHRQQELLRVSQGKMCGPKLPTKKESKKGKEIRKAFIYAFTLNLVKNKGKVLYKE